MSYRTSHLDKGSRYDCVLAAEPFDAYMTDCEMDVIASIVDDLYDGRVARYLDFACGTGRITSVLERVADESYGVDVSESMLAEARSKCTKTEFFHADLTRDAIDLEPVDLVTAFRFFGNAEHELRSAALTAIRRYLSDGGYLVLNNHRNPFALPNLSGGLTGGWERMDLSFAKLKRLFAETGFQVVKTYGIGGWIVHPRLQREQWLSSKAARVLERVSRRVVSISVTPDAVIVVRKQ